MDSLAGFRKVKPGPVHLILESRDPARQRIRLLFLRKTKRLDNPRPNILRSTGASESLESLDDRAEVANKLRAPSGAFDLASVFKSSGLTSKLTSRGRLRGLSVARKRDGGSGRVQRLVHRQDLVAYAASTAA